MPANICSAAGGMRRVVACRLTPGTDLLEGIEQVCKEYGLRHGVILSGIGSLEKACFFDPVELPGVKAGYGYSDAICVPGPIELISTSGSICEGESGEPLPHVHCCFADSNGKAFAGHLTEGCRVLLTADLVLGEFSGISMDRRFDEELGVFLLRPRQL